MTAKLLEVAKKLAAEKKDINLLNVYKGIPLSFPAKIVRVGENFIQVLGDAYQTVGMYIEQRTYLQTDRLEEIYRADVAELDTTERVATLANFRPVERGIGKRTQVRIQPKNALEGTVQSEVAKWVIRGELADLSLDGLAIYLARGIFSTAHFSTGTLVVINMQMPGEYIHGPARSELEVDEGSIDRFSNIRFSSPASRPAIFGGFAKAAANASKIRDPQVTIHARVVNLRLEDSHNRYRIGMQILSTDTIRPLLSQFISQRQSELIREIRALYDMLERNAKQK